MQCIQESYQFHVIEANTVSVELLDKVITINAVVYDDAPVDLIIGRNCPVFKKILIQAEGLDDILTISTRQQTSVEARRRIQQQKAEGFEPTSTADILGEDYDFPQTNQSIQEIVENDCNDDLQEEQQENTGNMEQSAKDQKP